MASVEIPAESRDEQHSEAEFLAYTPAEPQPVLLSRSHWFRPPPARS
jgi:hypothetical protein